MLKRVILISGLLTFSGCAMAQTPDPAFMQRAITALQTQRNAALDNAAVAEAKANGLQEELSKAQAKIKELEDVTKAKKPD